ncbi:folate receptor gamma-like [Styela clava]
MARLMKSLQFFLGCLSLVLYIVCAIDSEQIREMCYNQGNKTVRPWKVKNLTGPCVPWENKTCCTKESAADILKFNFDHCGQKMSEKCKSHFLRRSCFESCSPNLGPWVKNIDNLSRKAKFHFLPLCRRECETWWEDCKNELTCAEDWNLDFKWINGTNVCHKRTRCIPFTQVYKDSTYFCEHIYGPFDFLVVNDNDHCMTLFDEMRNNHFEAWFFADQIEASGKRTLYHYPFELTNNRTISSIFEESTQTTTGSPEAKYMILFFFLGGLLGVVVIAAGCFIIVRCKPRIKRSFSRLELFSAIADEEPGESELT